MKTYKKREGGYPGVCAGKNYIRTETAGLYSLCRKVHRRMMNGEDAFDEMVFLLERRGEEALEIFDRLYAGSHNSFADPEEALEIDELYLYAYKKSKERQRKVS